jgi:hypothetical protein
MEKYHARSPHLQLTPSERELYDELLKQKVHSAEAFREVGHPDLKARR